MSYAADTAVANARYKRTISRTLSLVLYLARARDGVASSQWYRYSDYSTLITLTRRTHSAGQSAGLASGHQLTG